MMLLFWWLLGMVLWIVPPVCIALYARMPVHLRKGWPTPAAWALMAVIGLNLAGWPAPPRVACSVGLPPVCVEVSASAGPAEASGGDHQ